MEMAKATPDKDNPTVKVLEVSELTNTPQQTEAQKLLTNTLTPG